MPEEHPVISMSGMRVSRILIVVEISQKMQIKSIISISFTLFQFIWLIIADS
jgi:hypothetical protein